ncbi:MAG: lamin tail domain-containing protein [Patescibacteria group bacterium]
MPKQVLVVLAFLFFLFFAPKNLLAANITINEFLAEPAGDEKEWIEIKSDESVDLSNYYLKDKVGTKKDLGTIQNCGSYYLWELSGGAGYLNNSGEESIFLYDPQDALVDSYENWTNPGESKTLSRIPDGNGDFQEADVTKCAQNTAPADPTPSPDPSPTSAPSSTTSTKSPSPTPKSSPKSTAKSPSPTPKPSTQPKESPQVLGKNDIADSISALSGDQFLNSPSPNPNLYQAAISSNLAIVFIGVGAVLIGLSFGMYLWYKKSSERPEISKEKDRFEENKEE